MRTDIELREGGRIELLDVLRGIALLAMAVYHFTWDLDNFGYLLHGTSTTGGWRLFARAIASSFLFLVGVSLVLAHRGGIRWRPFLVRLAQVAASALAITAVTAVLTPNGFVFFGILHQIAFASLVGLVFLRLPAWLTAAAGIALIAAQHDLATPWADPKWLAWTGLAQTAPFSNDFVPVVPWTGVVLLGIATSRLSADTGLWDHLRRLNPLAARLTPLTFIGRHALAFYLLHQPILFGLVAGVAQVFPPDRTDSFFAAETAICLQTRDESFCAAYLQCVRTRLGRDDLLAKLVNDSATDGEMDEIRDTASSCAEQPGGAQP